MPISNRSWLPLLLGVFAVSWAAVIIRVCESPPIVIAFYRMFFAAIILLPFAFLSKNKIKFKNFTKKSLILTIISGVFLGWHFHFWIDSLSYTTISASVVLVTTQPIYVAVLAKIFLHEKVGFKGVIAIFMALVGTILIAGFDLSFKNEYFYGDMLALAGAIMAACYMLIGRVVRSKIDVYPYIMTVYATAALTLGIIMMIAGGNQVAITGRDYIFFIILALVPTLIGHTIYNYALKHFKAHKVGIAVVGEPVLASIWALILFSEIPGWGTIAGGVVIITALVLVFSEKEE